MTEEYKERLGDRLVWLRSRAGIRRQAFAARAGIGRRSVLRLEKNDYTSSPGSRSLARYLMALPSITDSEIRRCLELVAEMEP